MLKEQGNMQMTLLNPPDDVDLIQIIGAFLKFLGSVFCGSLVPSELAIWFNPTALQGNRQMAWLNP